MGGECAAVCVCVCVCVCVWGGVGVWCIPQEPTKIISGLSFIRACLNSLEFTPLGAYISGKL